MTKMTKFQQIKMRVAKMPTYRGQREKDIEVRVCCVKCIVRTKHPNSKQQQRRLKNDAYFQQMGIKKTSKKTQRPSFIRVLQSLQDDGLLDQEKPKKEPRVLDAETLVSVKKSNETHEYVQRIHEISKYENEKTKLTKKLYKLGHDLEKRLKPGRNPKDASTDPSPAVRSFSKHTNCRDPNVARHYLKNSGWDISRAVGMYFEDEDDLESYALFEREFQIPFHGGFQLRHKNITPSLTHATKKNHSTQTKLAPRALENSHDSDDEIYKELQQEEKDEKRIKETKFRSTLQNTFEFMKTKLVHPTDRRLNLQTTLSDGYLRNGKPYKSLLSMRQAHSAQILNLVNQEEDREKERQRQLRYAFPKNRKRLLKRFAMERKEMQELIENVRADNETALAKRMIDMGLLR